MPTPDAFTTNVMEYVPDSYDDTIKNRIVADIKARYPWLGGFVLELVDIDPDTDTSYGIARLTGSSQDMSVEFPVFYFGGKLEDVSFFHMADKDLMLPFNKEAYAIISGRLNNAGLFSRVIAKYNLSTAMQQAMTDTDIKPMRDLLKVSSFTRIISMLPPDLLKTYSKTAMNTSPALIRELGSAVKLNSYRMSYKKNLMKKRIADKKAAAVSEPRVIPSIITPVFRSEAEAVELTDRPVRRITDSAYVIEGSERITGMKVPDTKELVTVVAPGFEIMDSVRLTEEKKRWEASDQTTFIVTSMTHNTDFVFSKVLGEDKDMVSPSVEYDRVVSPIKRSVDYDSHRLDSAFHRDNDGKYMLDNIVGFIPENLNKNRVLNSILGASGITSAHGWTPESKTLFPIKISSGRIGFLPVFNANEILKLNTVTSGTGRTEIYSVKEYDSSEKKGLVKCIYSGDRLIKIILTAGAVEALSYESARLFGGRARTPETITVDLKDATTFDRNIYSIKPDTDRSDEKVELKAVDESGIRDCVIVFGVYNPVTLIFDRPPAEGVNLLGYQADIDRVFSNFPIVRINYTADASGNRYHVEVSPPAGDRIKEDVRVVRATFPSTDDMIKAFLMAGFSGNISSLIRELGVGNTKLAVAAVPTEEFVSEDPVLEDIGEQISAVMELQQELRNDMKLRDEASAKQLELMNKKLSDIEEIQKTMRMEPAVSEQQQDPEIQQTEGAAPGAAVPPEVLNQLAEILIDPSKAGEYGLNEQDVQTITAAFEGDQQAQQMLGLDENSMNQVMVMVSSMDPEQVPAEGEAAQGIPGEEAAADPVDQEQARIEAYEAADKIVKAFLNPELMAELGVTQEDIGVVPIVLKTPGVAANLGIPGDLIDAIRSVYNTNKTELDVDNPELETVSGNRDVTDVNLNAANMLLNNVDDKKFKEFVRPVLNTSALLDLMPKVKTSKLFYNNADDFKKMLNVLGEILLNLNLNAVKFRESMGTTAFDKILARTKKIYDDFGNLVISMFDMDKVQ